MRTIFFSGLIGFIGLSTCLHVAASVDLFAVTDDLGVPAESLYRLDTNSAQSTLLSGLGNGDEGEVVVFNPTDGLIYHLSGRGAANDPVSGSILESVLPDDPYSVTSITFDGLRGDDPLFSEEALTGAYSITTGEILVIDADEYLYRVNTTGTVSEIADLGFSAKGLAFRGGVLYALEDADSFGTPDTALQLITLNPDTGGVVGSTTVTLSGVSLDGNSNALAVHPLTGELYAIVQGGGQRHFVTIDPDTGEATLIDVVSPRFDTFTFRGFFGLPQMFSASILGAADATLHAGLSAAFMVLNGVHQRPLLSQGLSRENCFWARGELAQYRHDRDARSDLAEIGVCRELIDDQLLLGIGVGKNYIDEDLPLGGASDIDGQYVVGELNYRIPMLPVMATLNVLYGRWDSDVRRRYEAFGLQQDSFGLTDLSTIAVRGRVDLVDLLWFSQAYATPYAAYTVAYTDVDDYTEVNGPFPVTFNDRSDTAHELRAGVDIRHLLSDRSSLVGLLEGVHHFHGQESNIAGTIGFTPFVLDARDRKSTWLRAGIGIEHRIRDSILLSLSVNASTDGRDPTVSGGATLRVGF